MGLHRLSALAADRIKPKGAKRRLMLCDGGNLWLQVTRTGSSYHRSWTFRYVVDGKAREMGIGPTHTISLARAREIAREYRELLLQDIDPMTHRDQARSAARSAAARSKTFDEVANLYIAEQQPTWRSKKHAEQWVSSIATARPKLGKMLIAHIDKAAVIGALKPIWTAKPESARRLRGRIEAVIDYAIAHGWCDGANPAQLKLIAPGLGRQTDVVEHHAALPYTEISTFVAALRPLNGLAPKAIEFLIYTAGRSSEVRGALWSEIDLELAVWTVPAERMKSGRAHRVPLSKPALAILEHVLSIRRDDRVFPGDRARPLSDTALLNVLTKVSYRSRTTIHGFRSCFRDWCAEQTQFPSEVAEMALAHAIPSAVEKAYRRGDLFDKRRQLMDAWASYCTQVPADNVVRLRPQA
jgi:integrase